MTENRYQSPLDAGDGVTNGIRLVVAYGLLSLRAWGWLGYHVLFGVQVVTGSGVGVEPSHRYVKRVPD